MTFTMKLLSPVLAAACLIVALAAPAAATFPGKNGRIAFVQGPDIFTMNPDGSDVRQLTVFTDDNPTFWENWSPDSKQLVFSRFPAPDFFAQLWLMNADGSNQHLLLNDPGFYDIAPSFSPDGSHIIFSRCELLHGEFPCAIYRVGVDGNGLTQITPVRIELGDWEPVYSPDGASIAFGSFGRDGVIAAIHLMNADGSQIHEVSEAELEGYSPNWSPDGRQLVLTSKCCNPEVSGLVVMKPDGRRVGQLTDDTIAVGRSSWSPQGDAIVFLGTNLLTGEDGIYLVNADGHGTKLHMKVRPTPLVKHSVRVRPRSHILKPKKSGPVTRIEDGGALPRWGSAQ